MPDYRIIDDSLLRDLDRKAMQSERGRINYNFHLHDNDAAHRFLNIMHRGTYIQPHRHIAPPKPETFLVLQGDLAFIMFNDDGSIADVAGIGENYCYGLDLDPGIWHSLLVLTESASCFEVKPGPYNSATKDKEFAPWAPAEGEAEAEAYLQSLEEKIMYYL